jgi:hypothetical protein
METALRVVQTVTGKGIARTKIDPDQEAAQLPDLEDPVEIEHKIVTKG